MRFYIATSLSNWESHNRVRDALLKCEHELTYDWTTHGSLKLTSKERLREVAVKELEALEEADFIVVLLPGGGGTHLELGYGLACGKKIFLHSNDPSLFELGPQTNGFYYHPNVITLTCSLDNLASAVESEMAIEK